MTFDATNSALTAPPIALQTYTVRDLMKDDLEQALTALAAAGYERLELAGLMDRKAEDVKALCDHAGLQVIALMAPLDDIRADPAAVAKAARTLGCRYAVCPYLPGPMQNDPQAYHEVARLLSAAGEQMVDLGVKLCYHNHAFEFQTLKGGAHGYDILLGESDPRHLFFEIDVYWAAFGHHDPLKLIQHLSTRVPLLHMKDMADDEQRSFTEIGSGTIDFLPIIEQAACGEVEFLIIEQDANWAGSPLASATTSLVNLQRIASQLRN